MSTQSQMIDAPWALLWPHAIVGAHGKRPVVLAGGREPGQLVTRCEDGLLRPIEPDDPKIARLLACVNALRYVRNPAVAEEIVAAIAEFAERAESGMPKDSPVDWRDYVAQFAVRALDLVRRARSGA